MSLKGACYNFSQRFIFGVQAKQLHAHCKCKYIFQVLSLINRDSFSKIVSKYESDPHCKGVNTWTHLVSMLFCQLAKANSVREIANGLRSATGNLNHM
ncbi:MAG: DUF4372 domain-containing protein [Bacteroidia bacterium]|nr:DUF4372 domain-containing protein [Bacteroidia bacterium]